MSTFEQDTLAGDKPNDKEAKKKAAKDSREPKAPVPEDKPAEVKDGDAVKVEGTLVVDANKPAPLASEADEGQGRNAETVEQKLATPEKDKKAPTAADVGSGADGAVLNDEKPLGEVTDEATRVDSNLNDDVLELVAPVDPFAGYVGPDAAGVVRKEDGTPVYAPPGSVLAANMGVQQDASGHFSSAHTNNGHQSGTRV